MPLYEIIKSLKDAQGNIAKQAILDANKDNVLLMNFMKAVYDPAINYYQTKMPKVAPGNMATLDQEWLDWMHNSLALRAVTGKKAIELFKANVAALDKEGQELTAMIIDGKIGASVGDTMVLETWPDLYFIPPYQRCSLLDDKMKAKFDKLKQFYIQPKLDGSFLYLVVNPDGSSEAITRAGSKYPQWFAKQLSKGLELGAVCVFVGEVEVFRTDVGEICSEELLPRQEGNGLLNAVLKGRDEDELFEYSFRLTAWDLLDEREFKRGKSFWNYQARLDDLYSILDKQDSNVRSIHTTTVNSLKQAMEIYSSYTARGLEGAVIKNLDSIWKDGTSKDNIKLKVEFEADYVVTAVHEGTGKAYGMMGALSIATKDGKLTCDVGTGFTDKDRIEWWNNQSECIGSIVTVKANDIISKRTDNIKSLFLPVFVEERFDKTEADTLEHVIAQLTAAKGL